VTLKLVPIASGRDPDDLAASLAPGFGGDEGPAREILARTFDLLAGDPRPDPWGCYLAEVDGETVGTCAFKSAPDEVGEVELAYMTFPAFEGRGHATSMVAALAAIADAAGILPFAHTLPRENASNRALGRNRFTFAEELEDPEDGYVWRWERRRSG